MFVLPIDSSSFSCSCFCYFYTLPHPRALALFPSLLLSFPSLNSPHHFTLLLITPMASSFVFDRFNFHFFPILCPPLHFVLSTPFRYLRSAELPPFLARGYLIVFAELSPPSARGNYLRSGVLRLQVRSRRPAKSANWKCFTSCRWNFSLSKVSCLVVGVSSQ